MIGIALSSISVPIKNCYDPSSTSTDIEEDILRIDNKQIVQKLVDWYQTVLHKKYEPIILNGTSDESFRPKQVTQFDQNGYNRNLILVRDNKLKFYRPRFHYSELNIKSRFLLCSFLNERRFPQSYENQKSFPGDLINNYINYTNDKIVNNQDLDVIYFYSEMYADNVRISSETTNLNLIDHNVSRWSYWNQSHVFMPNDIHVVRRLNQDELNEIANLKHYSEKWLSSESNLFIERIYRRFDAIRGLEYIIDAEHRKGTYSENIRLQLMKPLNPIELVADVAYVTENLRLTLILPVRGRMEVPLAIKFLNEYANLCLRRNNHQTILVIVLIYTHNSNKEDSSQKLLEDERKEFSRLKKVSLYIQSKYSTNSVNIAFMDLHPPKSSSFDHHNKRPLRRLLRYPSEMVYLDLIARSLRASSNEPFLMLHCRTNMLFSIDFLNRVRLNTIAKRQIFLPIPFVEYHLRSSESNSHFREILRNGISNNNVTASIVNLTNRSNNRNFDVRKENGFFDESNFEVVSFYLSDYLLARKFSEAEIPFVRNRQTIVKYQDAYYNSNLDLNHMFALYKKSSPTIGLMRAVEPELRLFHSTTLDDCQYFESNIMSFNNCKRRQHYGIGQKQKLALIVMEYLNL
ncbi:hypothetical protein RDWZM_004207 [Blomia tropicalis]|uniref:Hexosyltransferase n=1 Tax=Blomia tropicalis TaxID=40697 RepID=A0A9Q0MJL5_BLOTA|nr:hypothetical protein RDWZM_004207 [Blomia tropicalis]